MVKPRTNKKVVDWWSIPHAVIGYLFGRYNLLDPVQFTALNAGWEIFEYTVLKKHYDVFNTPFGSGTVYESPGNSVMDFLITEAGYFAGLEIKQWRIELAERKEYWNKAKQYARMVGKPFLVVGRPMMMYGCGDYTLDLNPVGECENEIQADIEDLSMFEDKQFGAVFASHVLEHIEDIETGWNELNRITDRLFVAFPHPGYPHALVTDHKWFIYTAPPLTPYLEYRRIPGR